MARIAEGSAAVVANWVNVKFSNVRSSHRGTLCAERITVIEWVSQWLSLEIVIELYGDEELGELGG